MKITFASVLLLLATLPTFGEDAAMFRANPQHAGVYDAVGVPKLTGVKWTFKARAAIYSTPAVANGVVYVGSLDHNLYAVDAPSGTQRWKFRTESRVTASPAVAGGTVFFGSMDGNFYAVDAASGQLRWKFATEGERRYTATHLHGSLPKGEAMPDPFDFYLSSPVVADGAVYFGSGDGNVYALEAATGALRWKLKTGDVVHSSPAVAGGTVYVGSWDRNLYAIDAATGKERWRFQTGDDQDIHNQIGIQSSPAVVDGIVYFGCRDSKLYALDAATGKQLWAFSNKGSWVIGSPAVRDGVIYFATSDSALFHALDAKTGAAVFSLTFTWPMFSSPAIAGDMLYIGSHEGKLTAINLTSRQPAWVFQTEASKQNGPALTKPNGKPNYEAAFADMFYDDMVVGVNKMLTVGAILSSPVVAGKTIYFGGADGYLYALE